MSAPVPISPAPRDEEEPASAGEPRKTLGERLAPVIDRWVVVFAAGCALVASLRLLPFQAPFPLSAFEAEARWCVPIAVGSLGWALWRRARRTALAHALALLVLVPWSLEWVPVALGPPASEHVDLRVVSANLLAPRPSRPLARELLESSADVLLIQEASDEWWALLEEEGVLARFPHHAEETHSFREDYMGIAIVSRLPILEAQIEDLAGTGVPIARIDVRTESGARVRLYSVHTWPPYSFELLSLHARQMARLRDLARADAADPSLDATVFGGDWNASPMSYEYRRLRDAGLVSAHERVGRGLATTWPNLPWPFPPMRLDHVFMIGEGIDAVSVREGVGQGSDHQPVYVELSVRPRAR